MELQARIHHQEKNIARFAMCWHYSGPLLGARRELSGRARAAASVVDVTAQISLIVEPDALSAGIR